ncbi:MAG: hypothetical protein ABI045_05300 [Flavobacteriales bacterium]
MDKSYLPVDFREKVRLYQHYLQARARTLRTLQKIYESHKGLSRVASL